MPLLTRALLALTLLTPCTTASVAQQSAPLGADAQTIKLNVITNRPAETLTPQDFTLLDNKAPRPITSLRRISDAAEPAHVIVVIDTVNVIYTRAAYVRSEVEKFFASNGGQLTNPTTFVVLTDKTTEAQKGFTTDGKALTAALAQYPFGIRDIRRDQGYWGDQERTNVSLKALDGVIAYAGTVPGRKIVLWISPGWPLLSGFRMDLDAKQHAAIFNNVVRYSQQLRLANVTLYNINPMGPGENLAQADYYQSFINGIRKANDTDMADLGLQVLAVQSGGLTLTSNSDVAGNMAKCVADTRSWYELTFQPAKSEHPDEYHHLQVNVAKPGITARTRDGYYAEP